MDKALSVVIAIFISAIIGGWWQKLLTLLNLFHLLDYPVKLLRDVELKLNRKNIPQVERVFRGMLLTIIVLGSSLMAGWLFSFLFSRSILTLILLTICLPIGSSWSRVNRLKKHLKIGNISAARTQLEGTIFRHHAIMDAPSLARASIEYLAVQFSEKIIAPIFWFMLLGVAGLFVSIAIYLLQETLSGASGKPEEFGKTPRDVQFLFNYIPSRFAAFLWIIATIFLPNSNWQQAATKISPELPAISPNRLSLLCAASCLNLSLGGKSSSYCNDGWIGNGKTTPSASDITRAQFLFALICSLLFVSLGIFATS